MRVTVGIGLGGACVREARSARLGEPAWGPENLLRDLELRLGLPRATRASKASMSRWVTHIASLGPAFYSASFEIDPLGTTEVLLRWRDALLDAGWDGSALGSERIDALARIEPIELRDADRLVRVESAIDAPVYDEIILADDADLWPARWRRVFERAAHRVSRLAPPAVSFARGDLGVLQRAIHEGVPGSTSLQGDGSLLLVRDETPADLAAYTAHELARATDAVVIRCLDPMPLETALAAHGLATQGVTGESAWRPAMQVLPLALELAFEPRDPHRLLELLTLPIGPFQGVLGAKLARAVARQPGVGGQEWQRQRADATRVLREREEKRLAGEGIADATVRAEKYAADRLARVAEWLEAPGARERATREALLVVVRRVSTWLGDRGHLGALAEAGDLEGALNDDARSDFSRDEIRNLFDVVARAPAREELSPALAGHAAAIAHPSALHTSCGALFVWSFVAAAERPPCRLPWTAAERETLANAGVRPVDPAKLLEAEAHAWRRAILAARERVVLLVPSTMQGVAMSPHSFWDEICGRLGIRDERSTVVRNAHEACDARLAPLALPQPPEDVRLPEPGNDPLHATALETLVTCPLRYVFEERAGIDTGAVRPLARDALLSGGLAHRLVEELHGEGAFELDERPFLARVDAVLDGLVEREAATLLLEGAAFERTHVRDQIRRGVRALHRWLRERRLRITAVEQDVRVESPLGVLFGRIDARLEDANGEPAILDLKWGASSHLERLVRGRAVQLAVYARTMRRAGAPPPPAAYFAIARGRALTTDPRLGDPIEGPSLDETWTRVERTALLAKTALAAGRVPAIGTRHALPLLEALGGRPGEHYEADAKKACDHCDYPALCGRAWEAYT